MKITILNGNPDIENRAFNDYLSGTKDTLSMMGHDIEQINLSEQNIKQCIGCWGCWVKTPGDCTIKDDMQQNYPKIISSDLLILASPMKMGFVSALLKKSVERLIPLLMPYMDIVVCEFHHLKRYEKYPLLGLIIEKEQSTDEEDVNIITSIYKRMALNFHSELKFTHLIDGSSKELINAINNI